MTEDEDYGPDWLWRSIIMAIMCGAAVYVLYGVVKWWRS